MTLGIGCGFDVHRFGADDHPMIGAQLGAINVKATTTERLGFSGRGEGMAAKAVALVMADLA